MNNQTALENQPRSLWFNLKSLMQDFTDATSYIMGTVSTVAQSANVVAETGLVLAESNKELVTIENTGFTEEKRQQLFNQFPHLKESVQASNSVTTDTTDDSVDSGKISFSGKTS